MRKYCVSLYQSAYRRRRLGMAAWRHLAWLAASSTFGIRNRLMAIGLKISEAAVIVTRQSKI